MKLKQLGPNMTELRFNGNYVLFSYETPVAGSNKDGVGKIVGRYHRLFKTEDEYSRTTTKHINKYFRDEWDVNPLSVEEVSQDYIDSLVS